MSRDAFLQRVQQAVAEGNRAGAPPLPERGRLSYQGGGPDPVEKFRAELKAAGGVAHLAKDAKEAVDLILKLAWEKQARKILLGHGLVVDALALERALGNAGYEVIRPNQYTPETAREDFFAADLGISGVTYLIAETGSVVVTAAPSDPRSTSLLPPVHIAVASRTQILPDLFDLFATLRPGELPSCTALITGPSKTGDIELKLVTGVHGPGEVHVIVIQ